MQSDTVGASWRRFWPVLLLWGGGVPWAGPALADRIVLRDFETIDQQVKQFDEDGVRLADGRTITWDNISEGKVGADRQAAFDKLLGELGSPLFRISQRLKFGDYRALLEHAESVYPRYVGRRSQTAYMVFQSLMWARIAAGQRELAVEPYLRAYETLRGGLKPSLPGERQLQYDSATALTPSLRPVWFDRRAAARALEGVRKAAREMKSPYPEGVYIYFGTLALAAGQHERGLGMLNLVKGRQREVGELKQIALAQHEVAAGSPGRAVSQLEARVDDMLPENRAAAWYWLGRAKLAAEQKPARLEGVLFLLRIPALYGNQAPELAGAGLYYAMETLAELNDVKGSLAVRRELQVRYAHTLHASKLRTASSSNSD